jgi:hypothetical protein
MSTTISTSNSIDNSCYTYEADGCENTAEDIYNYLQSYSKPDNIDQSKAIEDENKPHHPTAKKGLDGKYHFKLAPDKAKDYSGVNNQGETKSNSTNNTHNEQWVSSDPAFILARFRAGDKELFKLLSDPALGPILMAKIQDATAAETRLYTLLSNLQKSKDDTLKAIVNNIR